MVTFTPASSHAAGSGRWRVDAIHIRLVDADCGDPTAVAFGTAACRLSSGPFRARSSVGERSLHTREVAGSKPAAPILSMGDAPGFSHHSHPARSKPAAPILSMGDAPGFS